MVSKVLRAAAVMKIVYGFTMGLYLYIYPLTFKDLLAYDKDQGLMGASGQFLFSFVLPFNLIMEAVLDAPLGAYADIKGYKPTLERSFIFRGLYFLGLLLTASLMHHPRLGVPVIFITLTLFAVSYTLWSGASSAWLYESLVQTGDQENYLKYFSRIQTGYYAALIAGAVLSAYLYFKQHVGVAYGLGAVFSLAGAFFIRVYLAEPKTKKSRAPYKKQVVSVISDAWRYCLGTNEIYHLLQLGGFIALLLHTVNYFWPTYAKASLGIKGLDWQWISVIVVITLGSLAGNVYVGSRWKKDTDNEASEWQHFLLAGFFFGLPILLLSAIAISGYNNIWLFLALVAMGRIAFGAKDAPYEALMNRLITRVSKVSGAERPPDEIRATILSFASIFNAVLVFFFFIPTSMLGYQNTVKGWVLPASLLVIATILTRRKGNGEKKRRSNAA